MNKKFWIPFITCSVVALTSIAYWVVQNTQNSTQPIVKNTATTPVEKVDAEAQANTLEGDVRSSSSLEEKESNSESTASDSSVQDVQDLSTSTPLPYCSAPASFDWGLRSWSCRVIGSASRMMFSLPSLLRNDTPIFTQRLVPS